MSYRPQFAYRTPPGCRDLDFTYVFDGSNVPVLATNLAGASSFEIPLPLERDAPFLWRGLKVNATLTAGLVYGFPNVSVQFTDPYLNPLSDGLVPATLYGFPSNPMQFLGQLLTGPPVPLEDEIFCPAGSVVLVTVSAGAAQAFLSFSLHGVKRYKDCGRAQ